MSDHAVPKGVSLETLMEILSGWAAVGGARESHYTVDVENHTGIRDVVGRQNAFFEELGLLEPDGQKHRLTETGAGVAGPLVVANEKRAAEVIRPVLESWPPTEEIRGLVRENPMTEEELVPLIAAATGQDSETSRIRTGVRTVLELLEWADLLEQNDEGRYCTPESDITSSASTTETEATVIDDAQTASEPKASPEAVFDADLQAATEEADPSEPSAGIDSESSSRTDAADETQPEDTVPSADIDGVGVAVDPEGIKHTESERSVTSESPETEAPSEATETENEPKENAELPDSGVTLDLHVESGVEVDIDTDPATGAIAIRTAAASPLDSTAESETDTEGADENVDQEPANAETEVSLEELIEAGLPSEGSHTLTLNVDADPDDLESLIRGVKHGLAKDET